MIVDKVGKSAIYDFSFIRPEKRFFIGRYGEARGGDDDANLFGDVDT